MRPCLADPDGLRRPLFVKIGHKRFAECAENILDYRKSVAGPSNHGVRVIISQFAQAVHAEHSL